MLKTRKAVAKRIKITARKKFLHRARGQDHFNAKQSGKTIRKLHHQVKVSEINKKIIKRYLPYS